ncbi:hypothetical protein TTHERM_00369630 (macronuclear) [Tetrahymena thermophila SB210]|uniref:Uncharacterized protein n=1 Tax=Tetrahymena thermophila (strain SB210) TaxID=312017 RepID=Q22P74_TETTS|nr:hypothetical protein TTHERM_00369630 [Tetrahymena thermophila SB210]EAR87235.3 hypothetical protein TTHERM_00369630 [Tetrahymena thermophila SB210]|eukprot:XP_001007480.3 hypothetical protein TTHERM_00369630 [Tetrahymena thermophila SB210]
MQKDVLKKVQYKLQLIQSIDSIKVFYVVGDIDIDIDQLLDREHFNIIVSQNDFVQVNSINRQSNLNFIEIFFNTHTQRCSDFSIPVNLLRNSQQQDLLDLANLIDEYQKILQQKMKEDDCIKSIEQHETEESSSEYSRKTTNNTYPLSVLECDEFHGWNFEQSNLKAESVIRELKDSNKDSDNYYTYVIFQGRKYDQIKHTMGYSLQLLKDFLGLNDNQIDYLCLRKPIIINYKYQHQYIQYLFHRFQRLKMLFKQNQSDLNHYRNGLKFLCEYPIDLASFDNYCVQTKAQQYLYVLSNYKYQLDDLLWVCKVQPIGQQSASEVLKGLRNLKEFLKKEQENTKQNPFFDGQIYSNLIQEAQSKILKDKFYSIVDSHIFQDILENV